MNRQLTAALGAAFLSMLLALPGGANAQQQRPEIRPGEMHPRMAERPFSKPTERVEARLAYVKTALRITDRQQPQWDAYAALARKNAKQMEDRMADWRARRPARGAQPTAIERLERRQAMHANAVVRLNELLAVQKPLYAALTPEQQKVADVVLAPRFPRPGSMGRMGMRMGAMGAVPRGWARGRALRPGQPAALAGGQSSSRLANRKPKLSRNSTSLPKNTILFRGVAGAGFCFAAFALSFAILVSVESQSMSG